MAHLRRAAALFLAVKAVPCLAVALPLKHNDTAQSQVSMSEPSSTKDSKSDSINITLTPSRPAKTGDASMKYDGFDNLHARDAPTTDHILINHKRDGYAPWYTFDFLWSNKNLHNSPAEAQGQKPKGGDVVWQFLSAKSDPPDPAVDMIRVAFHLPFKYGGVIEPVKGAALPPGFPGMPDLHNFGTEKVALTRPGAFWTQKQPKQYTDDWSEYLNAEQELEKEKEIQDLAEAIKQEKLKKKPTKSKWDPPSGKSSDHRAKRDHVDTASNEDDEDDRLAARQDNDNPYWTPPGAGSPPVSDVVEIEKVTDKIRKESTKPPKPKMDTPGINQVQTGYPFFEDAGHPRIDNSSDGALEKIIDVQKASGMNKPTNVDVSDWVADDGLDDFGRTPYIRPSYPGPEHPRPTRPKEEQQKFPHDPSKPPTHPPGTIKEQDDAVRRRLFQRTLNETEYKQRNWNWMRCVNRRSEAKMMSLYLEAGGLWATENGIFRDAIQRRSSRSDCRFTGMDWKYWDQEQGWGDMTIKVDLKTRGRHFQGPSEESCSFHEIVYKAAQDAMAQYNRAGDWRALYMHGCGGPFGKGHKEPSSAYDALIVEIPNEVVYLDPPEKDMERFKDFDKYGVNVSPPFRSPLAGETKFEVQAPV